MKHKNETALIIDFIVCPIAVVFLFLCIARMMDNKDAKKYLDLRHYNIEIIVMLNNSALNVTTILHLHNVARDAKIITSRMSSSLYMGP